MPDGDCSPPGFLSSLVQNQIDSLFCAARCAHDEPLVALQDAQPVLDVGGAVAEAAGRFKADMIDQRCRAYLRDELFFAVVFRSEEGRPRQPVQAGGVAGTVGQFVEDGAVVFRRAHELLADGEDDFVGRGPVEGPVAFFGTEDYSKEELVAEIGAATLVNHVGLETASSFRNSAAYIQNWLTVLKGDKRFIVSASGKAEKAVNLILGSAG